MPVCGYNKIVNVGQELNKGRQERRTDHVGLRRRPLGVEEAANVLACGQQHEVSSHDTTHFEVKNGLYTGQ